MRRPQKPFAKLSAPSLLRTATINGLPGFVSIDRGGVLQTTALDVRDGRIAAIHIVRDPDKLRHLATAFATDGHSPLDH
jgi:RNA polymerase sigma-70 factor (ECF subfamily)